MDPGCRRLSCAFQPYNNKMLAFATPLSSVSFTCSSRQLPGVCSHPSRNSSARARAKPSRTPSWTCRKESTDSPLIGLRDMHYNVPMDFDNEVFRHANFAVWKGQFVVIIGENGAGKSTLLSLMIGFKTLRRGKIFWKGAPIRQSKLKHNIAMVMQRPSDFFLGRTVLEELIAGRPDVTPDQVRNILYSVGLQNVSLLQDPALLSGGQIKRLAVAGQLMRDPRPELFLLDEPLAGVDQASRKELAHLLHTLKSDFAVVVVSHEPAEFLPYADRIVQLAHRQIVEVPREVIDKAWQIRKAQATDSA